MKPQTKNEYVESIRQTSFDVPDVIDRGAPVADMNIKMQLKKLNESIKSYLLLVDNNHFTDAMLIAGHILETCSIISYAKDAPNNARKYVAKSTLRGLCDILDYDITNLQDEDIKTAFLEGLGVLEYNGHLAIKADKEAKKANATRIKFLKDPKNSNSDKKKCICDFYNLPIVEDYLRPFRKKVVERHIKDSQTNINLDRQFVLFYAEYCKIKHSNANLYYGDITPDKIVLNDDARSDVNLSAIPVFLCLDMVKMILGK
ncbi:MAG: hypothetical protein LBK26_00295 [Rickettsiales bacterium]|jgi:hypothetical protein|nr:hypothetical protein [Rickettsiales bacterium]